MASGRRRLGKRRDANSAPFGLCEASYVEPVAPLFGTRRLRELDPVCVLEVVDDLAVLIEPQDEGMSARLRLERGRNPIDHFPKPGLWPGEVQEMVARCEERQPEDPVVASRDAVWECGKVVDEHLDLSLPRSSNVHSLDAIPHRLVDQHVRIIGRDGNAVWEEELV